MIAPQAFRQAVLLGELFVGPYLSLVYAFSGLMTFSADLRVLLKQT
jgi:hypothetical protein